MDFETSESDIRNIEKITQLVRNANYAKALRLTQELKLKHKNKAIYQSLEVSKNVRSGITFIRSPSISSSELSFRVIIQAVLSFRSSIALMSDSISRFLVSMTINIFCINWH